MRDTCQGSTNLELDGSLLVHKSQAYYFMDKLLSQGVSKACVENSSHSTLWNCLKTAVGAVGGRIE